MNKLAVLISDIHFSINTLELASKSLQAALDKAEELEVPLIIAGDLNDTKAIIRAEVANTIINILKKAIVKILILVGNHDKVNEKTDEHGLNYLKPYAEIIDAGATVAINNKPIVLIPYQSNTDELLNQLRNNKSAFKSNILIMHQGFRGAFMGDYIQDKTSIEVSEVKDFRVFSGHYHRHQTLGTITYIGSPYTVTFGEANDGPKGFISINDDGTFERHILDLRKHIIIELNHDTIITVPPRINPGDLVWVKIKGPQSALDSITKESIGKILKINTNFKLEKIYDSINNGITTGAKLTDSEILDKLIDSSDDNPKYKEELKELWKELLK